jgi:hypothetical protein
MLFSSDDFKLVPRVNLQHPFHNPQRRFCIAVKRNLTQLSEICNFALNRVEFVIQHFQRIDFKKQHYTIVSRISLQNARTAMQNARTAVRAYIAHTINTMAHTVRLNNGLW